MSGKLISDPLFVGLTRPAMIFGVSLQLFMLNCMISMIFYIQGVGIKIAFIAGALHLIGYILCFKEPRFIELYINRAGKCSRCPNKSYYGANSYSI